MCVGAAEGEGRPRGQGGPPWRAKRACAVAVARGAPVPGSGVAGARRWFAVVGVARGATRSGVRVGRVVTRVGRPVVGSAGAVRAAAGACRIRPGVGAGVGRVGTTGRGSRVGMPKRLGRAGGGVVGVTVGIPAGAVGATG